MSTVIAAIAACVVGVVLAIGVLMILGFLATCLTGIAVGTFHVVQARQQGALRLRLGTPH